MSLFNETGHPSQDHRNLEAERYIEELNTTNLEGASESERQFIYDMFAKKENNELHCTPKQLFWLRDLYQKYVLEE